MPVFAFYYTGDNKRIRKFSDERQAFNSSNGFILVTNYADIVQRTQLTMPTLIQLHNMLADKEDQVSDFENRYQAARAIMRLAEERVELEPDKAIKSGAPTSDDVKETKAEKAQRKAAKEGSDKPKKAKQGRPPNTDKFSGKKIYPSKATEATNPHTKPGAKNYQSIELIRENPGITYEEYVDKGGVIRTLRNAVRLGRVTLSDT